MTIFPEDRKIEMCPLSIQVEQNTFATFSLKAIRSSPRFAYLADELVSDHYSVQTSLANALKATLCTLHNETVNVWIHGLGGLYFLLQCMQAHVHASPSLLLLCVCASICFLGSSLSHLVMGLGKDVYESYSRVDYAGISILVWGSIVSLTHAVFAHNNDHAGSRSACLAIASTASLATLALSFLPLGNIKSVRVLAYAAAASSAVIPLYVNYDVPGVQAYVQTSLGRILATYAFGVFFYVSRYPERSFPDGRFDRIMSSHNLWHMLVWLASFEHYRGLLAMMEIVP